MEARFVVVECPVCAAQLTVPVVSGTGQTFQCPNCGTLIHAAITQRGLRVSARSLEEELGGRALEAGRREVERFRAVAGVVRCPRCFRDVTNAPLETRAEERGVKAYTRCGACGYELEWASISP